jgi:DNA-binding XRE family transcriptional regulator
MDENQQKHSNSLLVYRLRMGFSQEHVAHLVNKHAATVSRYEDGQWLPPLETALKLGIILRVPVEFLFPKFYDHLRNQIRAEEERLNQPTQQCLL